VWDLPAPARWWRRALGEPPSALVADGLEWPLGRHARVGRSPDCDIVLRDDSVSRRHVEIAVRGGVCALRDLGSCNGTYVNGRRVARARLRRGDVLRLGETELRLR
jgi:pSer/pThr/pTyr-binding forkhead associated (FHA) protein